MSSRDWWECTDAVQFFPFLLAFLPVVAIVYALLERYAAPSWKQAWLLTASLFFYTWAKPMHLPLLVGSILFNWWIGQPWLHVRTSKRANGFSSSGWSLMLPFYAASNTRTSFLARWFSVEPSLHSTGVGIPLGVSFFTLTQVMYLVDYVSKPESSEFVIRSRDLRFTVSVCHLWSPGAGPLAGTSTS